MILGVGLASMLVAGCASSAHKIAPHYVSANEYDHFHCNNLMEEARFVSNKAARLANVQDKRANDDAVAAGVAIVLFWPAVFLVSGDGRTASELGRLRGEKEAIEESARRKGCKNIRFGS